MSLNPVVYLQPNKKKTRAGGLRCHVETMMNTEACEALSWTPSLGASFFPGDPVHPKSVMGILRACC